MNIISTDLRSALLVKNLSSLMLVNLDGDCGDHHLFYVQKPTGKRQENEVNNEECQDGQQKNNHQHIE